MWEWLAYLLAPLPDWSIPAAVNRRRDRRLAERGLVRGVLRISIGTQPGLSSRWRRGIARVGPGGAVFRQRRSRLATELPATCGQVRSARTLTSVWVGDDMRVVAVRVGGGWVDWALPSSQTAWVASALCADRDLD